MKYLSRVYIYIYIPDKKKVRGPTIGFRPANHGIRAGDTEKLRGFPDFSKIGPEASRDLKNSKKTKKKFFLEKKIEKKLYIYFLHDF